MEISKVIYGNTTLIDITDTTATASDVATGKYFYLSNGEKVQGTAVGGGMIVVETIDQYGGTIVEISGEPVTLQPKTAIPSTSSQVIGPDSSYTGLSEVTIEAIPSQYIIPTGTININNNDIVDVTNYAFASVNIPTGTARTSTDLTANGSTITAPAGLYSVAASKSVSGGTAATPATTISITPSISINTSTGVITATASGSQFVTPTISAGYVSAGTSGKITVSGSNTSNLTTQAAATITPTKSSQTAVAANRYTTGAITVAAIPAAYQDVTSVTATASDVLSGKTIVNSSGTQVNGSLVIQHYYTGSGTPTAATGSNGDIYLKTS